MSDKCLYCRKSGNLTDSKEYKKVKYHKSCHEEYKTKTKNLWDKYDKITNRS